MSFPLVSVILPVYNREGLVREAVESILHQSFSDFELLIIDDASTDKTVDNLNKINDPRIEILTNKKNSGVSASRNTGIKKARGKFIALMDSDDIALPHRLEKQVNFLNIHPEVGICGSHIKILSTGKIIYFEEEHEEILLSALLKSPFANPTVMIRRELLKQFKYDENLRSGEDYELWSRIVWNTKMYNIQESLVLYRTHSQQLSKEYWIIQTDMDVNIRLSLFKKVIYPVDDFPDEVLKKIFLFNNYFSLTDLKIFLNWIKYLKFKNKEKMIYPLDGFVRVLNEIKKDLLVRIYFTKTNIGIEKKWRLTALKYLSLNDLFFIIKGKLREYLKRLRT